MNVIVFVLSRVNVESGHVGIRACRSGGAPGGRGRARRFVDGVVGPLRLTVVAPTCPTRIDVQCSRRHANVSEVVAELDE
jgi:hypothetical protein